MCLSHHLELLLHYANLILAAAINANMLQNSGMELWENSEAQNVTKLEVHTTTISTPLTPLIVTRRGKLQVFA